MEQCNDDQSYEELRFTDYLHGKGCMSSSAPVMSGRFTARTNATGNTTFGGSSLVGTTASVPTCSSSRSDLLGATPAVPSRLVNNTISALAPAMQRSVGGTLTTQYQVSCHCVDDDTSSCINLHSISAMVQYQDQSHDELRFIDYLHGIRGTFYPAPIMYAPVMYSRFVPPPTSISATGGTSFVGSNLPGTGPAPTGGSVGISPLFPPVPAPNSSGTCIAPYHVAQYGNRGTVSHVCAPVMNSRFVPPPSSMSASGTSFSGSILPGTVPAPSGGVIGKSPLMSSGLVGNAFPAPNSVGSGTLIAPYQASQYVNDTVTTNIQSISAMEQYNDQSYEELRFADYSHGNRGTSYRKPSAFGTFSSNSAPIGVMGTSLGGSNSFCSTATRPGFGFFGSSTVPSCGFFGNTTSVLAPAPSSGCSTRTVSPPYQASGVKEMVTVKLQSISAMEHYNDKSHEELRFADYLQRNCDISSHGATPKPIDARESKVFIVESILDEKNVNDRTNDNNNSSSDTCIITTNQNTILSEPKRTITIKPEKQEQQHHQCKDPTNAGNNNNTSNCCTLLEYESLQRNTSGNEQRQQQKVSSLSSSPFMFIGCKKSTEVSIIVERSFTPPPPSTSCPPKLGQQQQIEEGQPTTIIRSILQEHRSIKLSHHYSLSNTTTTNPWIGNFTM